MPIQPFWPQNNLDFCQVCFKSANDLLLKFLLGQLHCFQVLFVLFLCLYCLLHGFFYPLRHLFVVVLALILCTYCLLCGCFCFLNQHFLIHVQILIGNHQCVVSLVKSDQVIDLSVLLLWWHEEHFCEGYGGLCWSWQHCYLESLSYIQPRHGCFVLLQLQPYLHHRRNWVESCLLMFCSVGDLRRKP